MTKFGPVAVNQFDSTAVNCIYHPAYIVTIECNEKQLINWSGLTNLMIMESRQSGYGKSLYDDLGGTTKPLVAKAGLQATERTEF